MTAPFIPPWQDKATLARHICLSDSGIDEWVKRGILPAPVKRGGKLMWRWSEVDGYLRDGGPSGQDSDISEQEKIRRATERRNQHAN